MKAEGGDSLRQELAALRDRLGRLETSALRQREEIDFLKIRIREFEGSLGLDEEIAEGIEPEFVEMISEAVPVPPPLPKETPVKILEREIEPATKESSFELQFGRVWLVRLGVVLLLTGLVLLGNFAYQNWIREMPNGVRLLGLFLCSGVLAEIGRRFAARPAMQKFGEVLLAGGLSFFYYCVFASHHVARLKVIESPVIAAVLLLGAAGLIAGVSWIRNAKTTAVLGLLLASYSTMLQPIGWLSCVSSTLLAAIGLMFMLRPGWAGPGVASMIGTYGAFLGWQLFGASRGDLRDPAMLWFLPPVWVMFSLPGVLGKFRETMSDYTRAWFTGSNNAAFFLLFSALWLWINRFETGDFWKVSAIFGTILVGLGIVGRRASQIAGGVNLLQGLTLVSLALILKLDGYHLALGLGIESVALAAAFAKFRGRSELVFSTLSAFAAMILACAAGTLPEVRTIAWEMPVWSAGLTALLIFGASLMIRRGVDFCAESVGETARIHSAMVFFFAIAAGLLGWVFGIQRPLQISVIVGISAALSVASLLLDRKRKMPEIVVGSLIFLSAGILVSEKAQTHWEIIPAGIFALAVAWLWHWTERRDAGQTRDPLDLKSRPAIAGWSFSAATVWLTWLAFQRSELPVSTLVPAMGVAGLLLGSLGVWASIGRLAACAALLNAAGLVQLYFTDHSPYATLSVAAVSIATLLVIWFAGQRERISDLHHRSAVIIVRSTAFIALCSFWYDFSPRHFGDGLALLAILLTAFAFTMKRSLSPEVAGFLTVATGWLFYQTAFSEWSRMSDPLWRGIGVVVALLLLVAGIRLDRSAREKRWIRDIGAGIACLALILWATQMLVWRHDWHAVSVLWTLLGFAFVSGGLGLKIRALRIAGFAILSAALVKLFAVDVWDFNAFMRVVSFIALGAALILLGLFYNRFAPMLKLLFEDEKEVR